MSLARSKPFDLLNITGDAFPYTLGACAGNTNMSGRRVTSLVVTPLNGSVGRSLATVIECNQIPTERRSLLLLLPLTTLLRGIADYIHKARQQINEPHDAPYGPRLGHHRKCLFG